MEKMTIQQHASKKIENWKKRIDQLEDQLGDSWDDAKDNFRNERSRFLKWIEEVGESIDKVEGMGKDQGQYLKARLDALKIQATLGKMESREALSKGQKQLNNSIQDTKAALTKMNKNASGGVKTLLETTNHKLESFHTRFDLFRLQMELSREETTQKWAERKKDIAMRVSKMKAKMEKAAENAGDRWEDFSEEMSEAWEHVKKGIKG